MGESLILGLDSSPIGTLVERMRRFTMLQLPLMEERGVGASANSGPALAGRGAEAVRDAITRMIDNLPPQLPRSLTSGQRRA